MPGLGRLVVCATPIGNLADVTARVLDELRGADIIEAEDTRITRRLLTRYEISTPLEPYHAKNLAARTSAVVARVAAGEVVALVSDAGMPGISDPGSHLVAACLDSGLRVDVLPGPSAIITALVATGLPTHAFYFGGFLPRKAGDIRRTFAGVAGLDATLIFYESPRRVAATLRLAAEVLPGRVAAMARELTKIYEEVDRGPIAELAERLTQRELKGEVVLLIGPSTGGEGVPLHVRPDDEVLRGMVAAEVASGASRRDAIAAVASQTGVRRNDVYRVVTSP